MHVVPATTPLLCLVDDEPELAELGLTRAEIGRASMDAARMLRAA